MYQNSMPSNGVNLSSGLNGFSFLFFVFAFCLAKVERTSFRGL